jgi:C4-dicarboxylate-binding protein DctP
MGNLKSNKFKLNTLHDKKNKFKLSSILMAVIATMSLTTPILSQAQVNNTNTNANNYNSASSYTYTYLRAIHSDDNQSPQGLAMLKFKDLLEARSNGKIKVDTFARHQKYNSYEELEALKLGTAEVASVQMSDLAKYGVNDFDIMSLPFLFSNFDVVHKIEDGQVGQALANKVETSTGFKVLGYWDNGFANFSANAGNLSIPSALAGTKMATTSDVDTMTANSLKALAVPVAVEDIPKALSEGQVNSLQEPLYSFYIDQYYTNQSKVILTNHKYSGDVILMNASYWNSLPQDQRSLIAQVIQEVTPYERQLAQQEADAALNQIKKDTSTQVIIPTNQDLNAYKESIKPVYENVLNGPNRNTLISIINELRK